MPMSFRIETDGEYFRFVILDEAGDLQIPTQPSSKDEVAVKARARVWLMEHDPDHEWRPVEESPNA